MNSSYYIRIWNANKRTFPHQAPAGLGISIRDGTRFLQNLGILGFSVTGLAY